MSLYKYIIEKENDGNASFIWSAIVPTGMHIANNTTPKEVADFINKIRNVLSMQEILDEKFDKNKQYMYFCVALQICLLSEIFQENREIVSELMKAPLPVIEC